MDRDTTYLGTTPGPHRVRRRAHEPRAIGRRRAEREIAALFVLSAASSLGLATLYVAGGQTQAEGALLFVALGAIAVALVLWAHRFLPEGPDVEPREPMAPGEQVQERFAEALDRDEVLERRPLLRRTLLGAIGALGVAAVFPIRSLGPRAGAGLRDTPWRGGARAVDGQGNLVKASEVPLGGLVTVFPEGHTDAADAQAVLVRVEPEVLRAAPGREDWAPDGLVAYSKLCTHAGCPVGLYQARSRTLLCPCHQSEFDVTRHARPTAGPAARALPQLPLEIDADGTVRVRGDFSGPVGPSWWSM